VGMVWPELNVDFNIVKGDDIKMRNVVIQMNSICSKCNVSISFYVKIVISPLILLSVIFFRKEIIEMADVAKGVVMSRMLKYTVEERISDIENRKPELKKLAEEAKGKLIICVFKKERVVELGAPGWKVARKYSMTGFSGKLGPKLVEGDRQIPEGVYGIEYLNPNSKFYLSVKVGYPNEDDLRWARQDGRKNLGGDIMIHGKNATVGCVPIGDDSIEDVFYLVNAVGCKNVKVIIAPYDMRNGRRKEWENNPLPWYSELCKKIEKELTISGPSSK
jgi:murein L,D-transpeptidase YafK